MGYDFLAVANSSALITFIYPTAAFSIYGEARPVVVRKGERRLPATIEDIDKLMMLKTWWWRYYVPQLLSAALAKKLVPGAPSDVIVRSAEVIDLNLTPHRVQHAEAFKECTTNLH